jgi:voltage-gated potassium channel
MNKRANSSEELAVVKETRFYRELANGRIEHRAEPVAFLLALLIIPALLLEMSSGHTAHLAALALGAFIWAGFFIELVIVLYLASNRRRTLRAHWLDVLIVVVTPPVMPALLQGARALRLLRLLRFLRLLLFGGRAIGAARRLFSPAGFPYIALLTALMVIVSGIAISLVESTQKQDVSAFRGIWWSLQTVATIGSSDVQFHTALGHLIAGLVVVLGIGFYAILTATIAAHFIKEEEKPSETREHEEYKDLEARLERIEHLLLKRSDSAPEGKEE